VIDKGKDVIDNHILTITFFDSYKLTKSNQDDLFKIGNDVRNYFLNV
jgi:hypothetical protein